MPNAEETVATLTTGGWTYRPRDGGYDALVGGTDWMPVTSLPLADALTALAARTREVEAMREEIAAMMRYDAQSTELLDWLMAHLSFHEWQRLGVPDPRRPRTRSDLLAARSYALAAQEGTR